MSQPYFSIIIPVYKVEAYLEQCLTSVRNQAFDNFECLVVNDGSPGMEPITWSIGQDPDFQRLVNLENVELPGQAKYVFDQVCGNDPRFQYFEKANEGLGMTRNYALQRAVGQRTVMLDSDDYLESNYLAEAKQTIDNNPEGTIIYGSVEVVSDGQRSSFLSSQKYTLPTNSLKSILAFPTWSATPVNYFWRLDIIHKYQLKFQLKNSGEDTVFAIENILAYYQEFSHPQFVQFKALYVYRQFENQLTKSQDFQIALFTNTTAFVQSRLSELYRIGLSYGLQGQLFVWRYRLYRERLKTTNPLLKIVYQIIPKALSLASISIAGI